MAGIQPEGKKRLDGTEMSLLKGIDNAWLLIKDGHIHDFGSMDNYPDPSIDSWDVEGRNVFPAWCDSHSHIVYAGNREGEFIDRIKGLSYAEIATKGGGILNSAKKLANTPENELFESAMKRADEVMGMGTGALEIKSGYGLSLDAELKILRVIDRIKKNSPLAIRSTFLGAHAVPLEFKGNKKAYLNLIINEMLPEIARQGLADYLDVFCETGYFDVSDTIKLMEAGTEYGLIPKIHVNQFTSIGGIKACVDHQALSVDHLEIMSESDFGDLSGSQTIATLLPSCSFFLKIPYAPARKMIDMGLPIALATDYNPGSTPSGNIPFVLSLACIQMGLLPEEAINAATLNGAYAMGLENSYGSITRGKKANLIITRPIPSIGYIPYAFGSSHIENIILNGKKIN